MDSLRDGSGRVGSGRVPKLGPAYNSELTHSVSWPDGEKATEPSFGLKLFSFCASVYGSDGFVLIYLQFRCVFCCSVDSGPINYLAKLDFERLSVSRGVQLIRLTRMLTYHCVTVKP